MKVQTKRMPRYLQLADRIKNHIETEDFPPGRQLPAQRELAERFDTTLMTIRKALSVLEEEGLIRTEHGVGTFVVDPLLDEDQLQLMSLSETIERQPKLKEQAETDILSADHQARYADAAKLFNLDPATPLGLLVRRRKLNKTPFLFQRSFLTPPFATLVQAYRPEMSLYRLLQDELGTAVTMAKEVVRPIVLNDEQANYLQTMRGQPAWLSLRLATNPDGLPIVYDEVVLLPDRVVLTIDHLGTRSNSQLRLVVDETFDFEKYLQKAKG